MLRSRRDQDSACGRTRGQSVALPVPRSRGEEIRDDLIGGFKQT